jgi:hypothetical protein
MTVGSKERCRPTAACAKSRGEGWADPRGSARTSTKLDAAADVLVRLEHLRDRVEHLRLTDR